MFTSFHHWLDRKLHVDAYELRGDEIVSRGLPKRRIRLKDIRSWQSFYIGGGVPSICFHLVDGRIVDWSDKHEHLFEILHKFEAEKELPFTRC
jgi:hypothetical protein